MSIIATIQKDIPLSAFELRVLLLSAPMRYKVHEINKRNGRGKRIIAQPTAEIKTLQRWAVENIVNALPVHQAAKAYRLGSSIKQHAHLHAANRYLLKMDFEDFFPSLRAEDFCMHMTYFGNLENQDIQYLSRLLFWNDRTGNGLKLSIGAPSSPAVSNTLMYPFDDRVQKYCSEIGVTYTRYADDLAFSTNVPNLLTEMVRFIEELCRQLQYPTLRVNTTKTVFTSKKYNRHLTGLILTNEGNVSIGRDKKRLIRAMVHNYANGKLPETEVNRLRGLLAYAHSIEPSYIQSIIRMIGQDQYRNLLVGR